MGKSYANILKKQMDIETIDDYVKYSIDQLQARTGIELVQLKKWMEIFDLFRIPGIRIRDAELLYYAQINSVYELAHRDAFRILKNLHKINDDTYYILLQFPSIHQIEEWQAYAKLMILKQSFGTNIPLIRIPLINYHYASELFKFKIITIDDFLVHSVSNLRKKIGMDKKTYIELIKMIRLIEINYINVELAQLLLLAGISKEDLLALDAEAILSKVLHFQEKEKLEKKEITSEQITLDLIKKILSELKINR